MQVKSIAECSKESILQYFRVLSTFIKLPFVIKIFVLSIFEWPLKTGFPLGSIQSLKSQNKSGKKKIEK